MSDSVLREALDALTQWHATEQPKRYVVCAGLAVTELLREAYPLEKSDYITDGNQVRTSGHIIKEMLARHGETRQFASEGGRTTRGTRPSAERLVQRLNTVPGLGDLTDLERGEIMEKLQVWLAERVQDYFNQRRIEVDIRLDKPATRIVADILAAAAQRVAAGPVAQHLVGAKLAIRFAGIADIVVENYNYTTADEQLGRPGDFTIRDTVFHVTVAPTNSVLQKCAHNILNNYRCWLLVPEGRVNAARELADQVGLSDRVAVTAIESFVGQNVEEIGEFGRQSVASGLRKLLETYNARVSSVETDRSLLIEVPQNLQ